MPRGCRRWNEFLCLDEWYFCLMFGFVIRYSLGLGYRVGADGLGKDAMIDDGVLLLLLLAVVVGCRVVFLVEEEILKNWLGYLKFCAST